MKAKVLKGNRKDQIGFVLTIIDSEGDDSAIIQFEDKSVESFGSKDIQITEE